MGTEVASRPTIPTGLSPGYQGPGTRRQKEREKTLSVRCGSAGSQGRSVKPIYGRDYHLRIQRKKYSLATSIVCIGAKIHQRYSPGITDERSRDHNVFRENTKYSNSIGKLREVSFISDPALSQSRDNVVSSQNPSPQFSNSQDFKTRYRNPQLGDSPCTTGYEAVTKNVDGCHELRERLADFDGELDDSFSFPLPGSEPTDLPYVNIEECDGYVITINK